LIIGGIIVGRDLIRISQIHSVSTDVARYTQAVTDFRDKYLALPGDFAGAEALWGSDTNCPNTTYTATPHTATCNGDGNGQIGYLTSSTFLLAESWRAWQQLADAGMIDGSFSGTSALGASYSYTAAIGVNMPASQLAGAGFNIVYLNDPNGDVDTFPVTPGHRIDFGAACTNSWTICPALTAAEALGIDSKIDDGMPGTGNVMGRPLGTAYAPHCTTTASAATAQYDTSQTGIVCPLLFFPGF
jgi:hypothetical protein